MTFKQAPQPIHDGAILSILHLNGYKIANPTILARISREELQSLFLGYGYKPYFVEGSDPEAMHQLIAKTLDWRKAPYRGTSHHPLLAILKKMPEAKR